MDLVGSMRVSSAENSIKRRRWRDRMKKNNMKGWLYLLPAFLFLGVFMVYPLVDVFIYSFEEGYNSASQTHF
jgi:multiple sugar transport system permease protein